MKKSYDEINAKLEEMGVTYCEFAYLDFDTHPFGEVVKVDHYGGEGKGEHWHSVYHFVDHDVYIRIDGWFSSHTGNDFEEGWYEVIPTQKNITVYEAKVIKIDKDLPF